MLTFGELVRRNAERWGDHTAYVSFDRRVTWHAFHERTEALANGLRALGVQPGDRLQGCRIRNRLAGTAVDGDYRLGVADGQRAQFPSVGRAGLMTLVQNTECTGPALIYRRRFGPRVFQ